MQQKRQHASSPSVKQEQNLQTVSAQVMYSGPLPLPDTLQGYEAILPGTAERMLSMTEKEQTHRHQNEDQMIQTEVASRKRGMWLAFTLCTAALGIAALIVALTPNSAGAIAAAILGASGFWSVARAMVISSKDQNDQK